MTKHATSISLLVPTAAQNKKGPRPRKPQQPTKPPSPVPFEANLRLARGAGTAPRNCPPRSRVWCLLNVSPPRSRALAPPTSSRLARGSRPLERISASLEVSLRSRRLACSPDRGIKRSDTPWAHVLKANPYHAGFLTQHGNLIPTLFEQLAVVPPSPVMCMYCVGGPVSLRGTMPPTLVLPSRHAPRKGTVALSKGVRPPIQRPSRMTP
jgi:hypothetical protein